MARFDAGRSRPPSLASGKGHEHLSLSSSLPLSLSPSLPLSLSPSLPSLPLSLSLPSDPMNGTGAGVLDLTPTHASFCLLVVLILRCLCQDGLHSFGVVVDPGDFASSACGCLSVLKGLVAWTPRAISQSSTAWSRGRLASVAGLARGCRRE